MGNAGSVPDKELGMGYIDAHVHVWTDDTDHCPLGPGWKKEDMRPRRFTPADLFRHCKPAGVERINLIQMSFYGFDIMSTRARRWLLAGLSVACLIAWVCLPGESAALAAAGRGPAGAARTAVEVAVGRPADRVLTNARGDAIGAALIWQFGEDQRMTWTGGDYSRVGVLMGLVYALGMVVIWWAPDTTEEASAD
jgi:hypothetical protein